MSLCSWKHSLMRLASNFRLARMPTCATLKWWRYEILQLPVVQRKKKKICCIFCLVSYTDLTAWKFSNLPAGNQTSIWSCSLCSHLFVDLHQLIQQPCSDNTWISVMSGSCSVWILTICQLFWQIFCDFCQFFQTGTEVVPRLGHTHFLSNFFWFISIESYRRFYRVLCYCHHNKTIHKKLLFRRRRNTFRCSCST